MRSGWLTGTGVLGLVGAALLSTPALAQLTPDNTLGAEQTRVTPVDAIVDRIDGGAARGINLFHSFRDFNVDAGRSVYFANPDGIVNILSRVTGGNPSNIFGRLGVLGSANLFLLNPNGIIFGENASLDITGSFVATTAEAIALGDQGYFSAKQPQQSQLLSIEPGALFFNQLPDPRGRIQNTGSLAVGQDLTLAADTLDLQGQLQAGRNLTLQGQDTVRIRDSVTRPFLAAAGGQLLVQGNQLVDIFALNHPNSGLFSGGDMVLRSANTVGGDAHYWSYGNFRVETLNGSLGSLYSPFDPIILASGDVSFDSYNGSSLHIFAQGSVTVSGNITVLTSDDPTNSIDQTLFLSDGTRVVIAGSTQPTLDIRAGFPGVAPPGIVVNSPPAGIFTPAIPTLGSVAPTRADITIQGNISIGRLDAPGLTLLTNQYPQPLPPNSLDGSITVDGAILAYGPVYIDSRNEIRTGSPPPTGYGAIDTSTPNGPAGEIRLIANGTIDTTRGFLSSIIGTVNAGADPALAIGRAGNITLFSRNGDIRTAGMASQVGGGRSGDIILDAGGSITTDGNVLSFVGSGGQGDGGDIFFISRGGDINTTAGIVNSTTSNGSSGTITFAAAGDIITGTDTSGPNPTPAIGSYIQSGGSGQAGLITFLSQGNIDTRDGSLNSASDTNGISAGVSLVALGNIFSGNINSFSSGVGDAGDIILVSGGIVSLEDSSINSATYGPGRGGDITISSGSVSMTNSSVLASTTSQGTAGGVSIEASGTVSLSNSFISTGSRPSRFGGSRGAGNGGDLEISADRIDLQNISVLETNTFGLGNSGNVTLNTQTLNVTGGSEVQTLTDGAGTAGTIEVNPLDFARLSSSSVTIAGAVQVPVLPDGRFGGFSSALIANSEDQATETGQGGQIIVRTGTLNITDAGAITARTRSSAPGGNIALYADTLNITGGGQVVTTAFSSGLAGGVTIEATGNIIISGFDPTRDERFAQVGRAIADSDPSLTPEQVLQQTRSIFDTVSSVSGVQAQSLGSNGTGSGPISITSTGGLIAVSNTAQIDSSLSAGYGQAGVITFTAPMGSVTFDNAAVFSTVESGAVGNAGGIGVQAASISMTNGAQLQTLIRSGGVGTAGIILLLADGTVSISGDNTAIFSSIQENAVRLATTGDELGAIFIGANTISITDGARLDSSTFGSGNAGLVVLLADDTVSVSDSTILSVVGENATGDAGGIGIQARSLTLDSGANVQALTRGRGNAGIVLVNASDSVNLSGSDPLGFSTGIFTSTESSANGIGGTIEINTGTLRISDAAVLSARTRNNYAGGDINVNANQVEIMRGGQILTTAFQGGPAGSILVQASDSITLDGRDPTFQERQIATADVELLFGIQRGEIFDNVALGSSGLFSNTAADSTAVGGDITVTTGELNIRNQAQITVDTQSLNQRASAGEIEITANSIFMDRQGEITATTNSGNGGNIFLNIQDLVLLLRRDSQISTNAGQGLLGAGDGGNIFINSPFIVAAPSRDSNITATAVNDAGGNVQISSIGVFGIKPRPLSPLTNDISASSKFGAQGVVVVNALDTSFIQDSLTDFSQTLINTNQLLSNSCIVRSRQQQGSFVVTGTSGLPVRPGDAGISNYPTGTVRSPSPSDTEKPGRRSWKPGDPIVEPQGVYQLPDGRLVLSRECP